LQQRFPGVCITCKKDAFVTPKTHGVLEQVEPWNSSTHMWHKPQQHMRQGGYQTDYRTR